MKNIIKAYKATLKKERKVLIKYFNEDKGLDMSKHYAYIKQYLTATTKKKVFNTLKERDAYILDRHDKIAVKKLDSKIQELESLEKTEPIKELTIDVVWRKNRTWGSNPTAEAWIGGLGHLSSGSIGGCGYDKQSAAVANLLNQVPYFKYLLYKEKNRPKNIKRSNREIFGYGSGYYLFPSFEQGVGVNCYESIFRTIGYEFKTLVSKTNIDVYQITKRK